MDLKNVKQKVSESFSLASFLTLAGFIFILYFSWSHLQSSRNEEEELHGFLQDKFQTLVSDFIIKKHPEVDEITFHKVWTKSTSDPNRIKIFFSYSLVTKGEAGGDLLIEGESLLEKSFEVGELWIVKKFQIKDSLLEFSEPLVIRSDLNKEN